MIYDNDDKDILQEKSLLKKNYTEKNISLSTH